MGYSNGTKLAGGKAYRQHTYLKDYVKARDNYTCQLCGATQAEGAKLEVDHIIPWSISHDSTLENLRTLCLPCNRATRRKRKDAQLPQEEYTQWLHDEIAKCKTEAVMV